MIEPPNVSTTDIGLFEPECEVMGGVDHQQQHPEAVVLTVAEPEPDRLRRGGRVRLVR